jgi:hypothetical protein
MLLEYFKDILLNTSSFLKVLILNKLLGTLLERFQVTLARVRVSLGGQGVVGPPRIRKALEMFW